MFVSAITMKTRLSYKFLYLGCSQGIYLHSAWVFISSAYCNKLPQTVWLKTTEIYSHNSRSQMSNLYHLSSQSSLRAKIPLETLGENPVPWLSASGGCWHSLACGHIPPVFKISIFQSLSSSSHCSFFCEWRISLCLPFIRRHVIASRADLDHAGWSPQVKTFNLISSSRNPPTPVHP